LIDGTSVGVIWVSGGEFLRVNHDNGKTVSVNLLFDDFPNLSTSSVFKVRGDESIAGLSSDGEVPHIRVGKVIKWWVKLNTAGESGDSNSLGSCNGSVVKVVVWQQESSWSNSSGGLDN